MKWYFEDRNTDTEDSTEEVVFSPVAQAISKTEYTINEYGINIQTVSYAAEGDANGATQKNGSMQLRSTSTYELTAGNPLFGKQLSFTDTAGYTTTYMYNNKGFLQYEIYNDGYGLYYNYDALGRKTYVVPTIPASNGTPFPLLTVEKASYSYDSKLRHEKTTTASTTYSFVYDDFGNTIAVKVGEGDTAVTLCEYSYGENNGKLMSMTYGNGKEMTYIYDALDRVAQICYNDYKGAPQSYTYTYTADGAVYSVECTESDRVYYYNYNTKGQQTGKTEANTNGYLVQSAYWYDALDRLDVLQNIIPYVSTSGKVDQIIQYAYYYDDSKSYTADSVGALSEFVIWGGGDTDIKYVYDYDKLYRLSDKLMYTNDEFYQDFSYVYRNQNSSTTTGQLGNVTSSVGTNTGYINTDYRYEYDNLGNISKIIETISRYEFDDNGNVTETIDGEKVTQYDYDDLGQLTREDNPYLGKTYTYTYDNAGNRLSKTTYAYTTGTLGTATATQTYTYNSTSTWGDQLSGTTYDAIGNPLTYNGYAMTWSGRQLMEMNRNAGQSVLTFAYNSDGIRTSKNINGTVHTYTLNGTQVVSETWGQRMLVYLYDESGSPIGLQYRQSSYAAGVFDTYYFEKNIFGDIVAVYTAAGVKIGSYTYDAWGNCSVSVVSTNTSLQNSVVRNYNPFRYRGYFYDYETGLYYLQSRYYNPATGRFINADGYINANGDLIGFNMYAYCSNNPVMLIDASGCSSIPWRMLLYPGEIHRAVQIHILLSSNNPGSLMVPEYSVSGGRIDIIRINKTGPWEVYEIKPTSYRVIGRLESALMQLAGYMSGVNHWVVPGESITNGTFIYRDFQVTYQYECPGLILYEFELIQTPQESEVFNPVGKWGGYVPSRYEKNQAGLGLAFAMAYALVSSWMPPLASPEPAYLFQKD